MDETKLIDKTTEVYKKRQAEQDLRRRYRERAIELYSGSNVDIIHTSTPVVHEHGAYISAVVFIPIGELNGKS